MNYLVSFCRIVYPEISLSVGLFQIVFLSLLYLLNIISFNFLLTNDREQANPAGFSTTIEPIPVTDILTDVVVEPIITTVSTDSNIEVSVLLFYISFLIYKFYFEIGSHFLNVFN